MVDGSYIKYSIEFMHKGSYKNLKIWMKGIELAKKIHLVTKKFPPEERYSLTDQIRRASVSIPSNIAEGSRRSTNKDFAHFIAIARGSIAELETQIILASSFKYISKELLEKISEEINQLDKMIFAFHKSLKNNI